MKRNRVLVPYPADLIAEIDKIVEHGKRTTFLIELAQREIKLRRQRDALKAAVGAWKAEDHAELVQGSAAWVQQLRAQGDERQERIERHRDEK